MPFLVIATYIPSKFTMKNGRNRHRIVSIKSLNFKNLSFEDTLNNLQDFYEVIIRNVMAKARGKE